MTEKSYCPGRPTTHQRGIRDIKRTVQSRVQYTHQPDTCPVKLADVALFGSERTKRQRFKDPVVDLYLKYPVLFYHFGHGFRAEVAADSIEGAASTPKPALAEFTINRRRLDFMSFKVNALIINNIFHLIPPSDALFHPKTPELT